MFEHYICVCVNYVDMQFTFTVMALPTGSDEGLPSWGLEAASTVRG